MIWSSRSVGLIGRRSSKWPLEIITSDSAAGTLISLKRRIPSIGAIVVVREDLFSGPLVPLEPLKEFQDLRNWHWCAEFHEDADILRVADDRFQSASEVLVWMGPSASERLGALATLAWLRMLNVSLEKISVIDASAERWSLGTLNRDALERLRQPKPLVSQCDEWFAAAWSAVTSTNPEEVLGFAANASAPKSLRRLMRAIISLYPRLSDGLDVLDAHALNSASQNWQKSSRVVARVISADIEDPNGAMFGDLIIFDRLLELSHRSLAAPLLEMRMAHDDPKQLIDGYGPVRTMRNTEVRLTRHGKVCLAGEMNHVEVSGIERWVAGVYLTSRGGNVWFRDGDDLVPA